MMVHFIQWVPGSVGPGVGVLVGHAVGAPVGQAVGKSKGVAVESARCSMTCTNPTDAAFAATDVPIAMALPTTATPTTSASFFTERRIASHPFRIALGGVAASAVRNHWIEADGRV